MNVTPRRKPHQSAKARGRKPSQKSVATRQLILDGAAALFAERGYGLTTLADIAESIGIHLTGLYYYYDNKEQLACDIIASNAENIRSALEEAIDLLPKNAGALSRLSVAIDTYLNCIHEPANLARAAAKITSQLSEDARGPALEGTRENNSLWLELIEQAIAEGTIRSDVDPKMIQMSLLGSMNWSVEWFDSNKGPTAPLAKTIKAAFLEGLGT